ncbi:hypothetical protein A2V71_03150 [Candidatus Berkelbacteria bacterium RBG_13_40_8]|uniref:GrpB family protein n=1 Tax=Candidatus Berkelbacteria bacterium RBG_13_40_8 TaxID=1797467 RepID=A0A1F5DP62_9BACT|nr:MAG: hypothetical protein A2V71_03150 [Candidatus Berkelbacteria bacterium RBG_13_40_8]
MLTKKQINWINHLSDIDKVTIVPFDPSAKEKYLVVKKRIHSELGSEYPVLHCGATSLGISGQNEIDIYIPVEPSKFNSLIKPLISIFGEPKSLYPLERARFVTKEAGKHIDVFLINSQSDGWLKGVKFENYLKSHKQALNKYRKLKEDGNGLSVKEYYKRKVEFINEILARK